MVNDGVRNRIEDGLYDVLVEEGFVDDRDQRDFDIDSLGEAALVMGIEDRLSIRISDEDIGEAFGYSDFGTRATVGVDGIVAYLIDRCDLSEN